MVLSYALLITRLGSDSPSSLLLVEHEKYVVMAQSLFATIAGAVRLAAANAIMTLYPSAEAPTKHQVLDSVWHAM